MSDKFQPTHRISDRYRRIAVRVVDGVCYTRAEWDSVSTADWEIGDDGRLYFMGVAIPRATIRAITGSKQ